MTPVLHGYFRSSASYRVRMALNYKGIEYRHQAVNLLKGEQKGDGYAKLNPSRLVPTLEIDGLKLTQSLNIIDYLDERNEKKKLLPKHPEARAVARALAHIIACDTQPVQNLRILKKIHEQFSADQREWAHFWITRGFTAFEEVLAKEKVCHEGAFCVGNEFSLADVCVIAQVPNAERFGVEVSDFPLIHRVWKHCETFDYVQKAHPLRQDDCPENLRIDGLGYP